MWSNAQQNHLISIVHIPKHFEMNRSMFYSATVKSISTKKFMFIGRTLSELQKMYFLYNLSCENSANDSAPMIG